jgi:hypothetical protein
VDARTDLLNTAGLCPRGSESRLRHVASIEYSIAGGAGGDGIDLKATG